MAEALAGRTVMVTGAGGSIGTAVVRRLVESGAEVLATDLEEGPLTALRGRYDVRTEVMDVTSEASVAGVLAPLALDGLVNCAGHGGVVEPTPQVSVEVFDRIAAVNARGVMLTTKHAARAMVRARSGGSIVNVSSQAALVGLEGHLGYGATKGAVDAMTRVSALDLGRHGIRVNSVNPTVVMTPMSTGYWDRPEIGTPFLARMPLGRWATPDEVAGPVVFLLSSAASMITGTCLPVDGGYTAQ